MKFLNTSLFACGVALFSLNMQAACITQSDAVAKIKAKHQQNAALLGNAVGSLLTVGAPDGYTPNTGWRQTYTNQDRAAILISQCDNTGAHIVQGFIRMKFDAINGVQALGFPTTDEMPYSSNYFSGRQSKFKKGVMLYKNGATWSHGTYAILNNVYNGSKLYAETTQRNQDGGVVTAMVSNVTPHSTVHLYVNSWQGQIPMRTATADANGFAQFAPYEIKNTYAGAGNASGYVATLEADDGHGKINIAAVALN